MVDTAILLSHEKFHDENLEIIENLLMLLDKYIKLGKDPLNKSEISNVVYKIPCLDCLKTYVGQTGRVLFVRCDEHKKNINLNEKYHNAVTKHRINNKNDTGLQHNLDWNNIKILHKETNYFKRIIAEMFHIKKEGKNSINVMSDLKDYNASYDIILDHLT